MCVAGRNPPPPEAVGGGTPVTPRQAVLEQEAGRAEPFEISHDGGSRQEESEQPQGPSEQEILAAQIQQDDAVIEGIRRAEVGSFSRLLTLYCSACKPLQQTRLERYYYIRVPFCGSFISSFSFTLSGMMLCLQWLRQCMSL